MAPTIADLIKVATQSRGAKPDAVELQVAWRKRFGVELKNNLAQAMGSYMADGIEPSATATVVISGPIVYEEVAQAILAAMRDEGDVQSSRQRESQDYNAQTSDNAESSWWVSTHDVAALRARQYPDERELPSLSGDGAATWKAPTLAVSDETSGDDATTRYKQQFIVQLDGDEVSLQAAQSLFGKHPNQSTFIQLQDDELVFYFSDRAAEADYRRYGPGQFLYADGDIRLSFVGHGINNRGIATLGGKTVTQFLASLDMLLKRGAISSNGRLVINLVACAMDDLTGPPSETFAGQLVAALPGFVARLALRREVEVHARVGAVSINDEGRKSQSRVVYRYEDDHYVRETTLDLSATDSQWDRINIAELGLRSETSSQTSMDEDRFSHHLILTWDDEPDNLSAAVAHFNRDPAHSTYVDLAREGRTVVVDERLGQLMVREGYSALAQTERIKGNVNVVVFGQSVGMADLAVFDGLNPKQLVDRINPVLSKVFPTLDLAHIEGNHLTITLEGFDHADPLLDAGQSFIGMLAGKLQFWLSLQPQADSDATLAKVSFETRAGHLYFDGSGSAIYVSASGKVLEGEIAKLYDALHRSRFDYDPTAQNFKRVGVSSTKLGDIGRRIASLRNHPQDPHARDPDLDRLTVEYLKLLRHGAGAPAMTPHNRTVREEMLADLSAVLDLRRERLEALATIGSPGEGYLHVPERVEAVGHGSGYRLGFVRRNAQGHVPTDDASIVWVHTDNDVFMRWLTKAEEYGHAINSNILPVASVGDDNIHYWLNKDADVNAPHTVSTAYLFQALIGPEDALLFGDDDQAIAAVAGKPVDALSAAERDRIRGKLRVWRAQLAVNYAQLTHGTFNDAMDVVRAVHDLKSTSSEIGSAWGTTPSTLSALGIAFDVANVVLASIDFANAQGPSEKTRSGARLSVALVTSGMSIGALAAAGVASDLAQAGLTDLAIPLGLSAEVLGALSIPVAGVGMGVVDVIDAYDKVAMAVDSTLHTLEQVTQEAKGPPLVSKEGLITFTPGLALTRFDMSTGAAVYGSVRIRALKKYNRIVAPDPSGEYLDVYQPFLDGVGRTVNMARYEDHQTIVLPAALQRDYDYTLVDSPGWRRSHDFPGLEMLERAYPERFYWWTYRQAALFFGWDYSPSHLRTTYHRTPFTLKLDASARGIVVPSVQDALMRDMLAYTLVGKGGQYTVALPMLPTTLSIQASPESAERWYMDVSNAVYESVVQGHALVRGKLRRNVLRQIDMTDQRLTINGATWASFEGELRSRSTLFITLGEETHARLVLSKNGQHESVLTDALASMVYLQFDSCESVDPRCFQTISDTLERGGLGRGVVYIRNQDESYGVVDLKSSRWAVAKHDSVAGTATFYLDGIQKISLRSDSNFEVSVKSLDGATVFMTSMSFKSASRMVAIYLDGRLKQLFLDMSSHILFDAARGVIKLDLAEHEWLRQFPGGTEFTALGSDRQSISAVIDRQDSSMVRPRAYSWKTERFTVEVDLAERRAVVGIIEGGELTAQDFRACRGMFLEATAIDFNFFDHSGTTSRLTLDTADTLFRNKAITLSSVSPLVLVVKNRSVSWLLDGEDITLCTPDMPDIKWLNATRGGLVTHALDVNDAGAKPLLDALQTSATPATASVLTKVDHVQAATQLLAAHQMAQAINAYPDAAFDMRRARSAVALASTDLRLTHVHPQ